MRSDQRKSLILSQRYARAAANYRAAGWEDAARTAEELSRHHAQLALVRGYAIRQLSDENAAALAVGEEVERDSGS